MNMTGPAIEGLEFVRPLGTGGYSEVFLYAQRKPRMEVAVKVLNSARMSADELHKFASEAETMAQLGSHPFIVPVFATGTTVDGRPYIVMKFYPRDNLGERSARERLTVAEVLKTGIEISSAVETAHRAGILHRDIKPANILVGPFGEPGLADFGIAGRAAEIGASDKDLGVSIPWSPPEVLTGESDGTVASDVYSLAATVWNLLAGRSPFSVPGGDNGEPAVVGRILRSAPTATGRADVPLSLERLLQQAMSKKPEMRPVSAIEFARSLQMIEQELRYARTEIVVAGDPIAPESTVKQTAATKAPSPKVWAPPSQESSQSIRFAPDPSTPNPHATTVRPTRPQSPVQSKPVHSEPLRPDPSVEFADQSTPGPAAPAEATPTPAPSATIRRPNRVDRPQATPSAAPEPGPSASSRERADTHTVRRPTSAPAHAPHADLPGPVGRRKNLKMPLVAAAAGAAIVGTVIVGLAVMSSGKNKPAAQETTPVPMGTDQGGFGGDGVEPPIVTAIFDSKRNVVTFSWKGTSDTSPAKFVYSSSTAPGLVGPTTATSVSIRTRKPSDVCITVATVSSDGTRKPAAPVCGH